MPQEFDELPIPFKTPAEVAGQLRGQIDAAPATLAPNEISGEFIPLELPTHNGQISVTHPSVVDCGEKWYGYRYWMAFTPWPPGSAEVPNIVASNDLIRWVVPVGLTNPIATVANINTVAGASLYSWLADTHLLFHENKLWCYYLAVSSFDVAVCLQQSENGTDWGSPEILLSHTGSNRRYLSPSVVHDGGQFHMYVIDRAGLGATEKSLLKRYTSADGKTGWSAATTCSLPDIAGSAGWHLDMKTRDNLFHALITPYVELAAHRGTYYYTSEDGVSFSGSSIPCLPLLGTYDGVRHYRASMLPASPGRWHVITGTVPKDAIQETGNLNPWRIGLRRSVRFEENNYLPNVRQGYAYNSFFLRWSSGQPIPSGKSFDICDPNTRFVQEWAGAQAMVTIWGSLGTAAAGGIWACGQFFSSKMSTGPTNATFQGTVTPFLSLSAIPDNISPTSGMTVEGVTSGAVSKFHKIRFNSAPNFQYSLREFSGTAVFQVGERIRVNGVECANGGTPVTISALNYFPAANSINLIYVDSVSGYPGRYQLWNSSASNANVSVKIESNR